MNPFTIGRVLALSEGMCPTCKKRLRPVPKKPGVKVSGYCMKCCKIWDLYPGGKIRKS